MPTIRKEIDIEAPVDEVFEVCENPEAIAHLVPQVTEVNMDRRTEERVGDQFRVVYGSLGGAHQERAFTFTEYEKPKMIAVSFEGEPRGSTRYSLRELE